MELASLKTKCAELQQRLNEKQPGYVGVLKQIHEELNKQPELTYKLDDAEIATLIAGLSEYHRREITEPKMKKPISKKQGNLLSADDV
jgi:hypothetical protein